jgi:NAD(P)-dependent dehydrogenase (short-subunit alcohol dehydrogenase family)
VTVNAVVPGLIDTRLTRHRERYVQALEAANAGKAPAGAPESNAKAALARANPTHLPGCPLPRWQRLTSTSRLTRGWSVARTIDVTAGDSAHF